MSLTSGQTRASRDQGWFREEVAGWERERERRVAFCLWRAVIFKRPLHSRTLCLHKGSKCRTSIVVGVFSPWLRVKVRDTVVNRFWPISPPWGWLDQQQVGARERGRRDFGPRLVRDNTGSNKEKRPKSFGPPQPTRLPVEPNWDA